METVYESERLAYTVEDDGDGQITIRMRIQESGNEFSLPVPKHVREPLAEAL